jgi:hypothetical protein
MTKEKISGRQQGVSRRDFGRGAVLALAGAAAVPAGILSSGEATAAAQQAQTPGDLSPELLAEIDAKMQNILRKWGDRLSEDQRTRLRSTVTRHVRMLETIRAYPMENGDCPASVLKLVEIRSTVASNPQTAPKAGSPSKK